MSALSFGFPSLPPSHTEEAWFPRLESDEIHVIAGIEEELQQQVERIQYHAYPSYVGASAPEEEDDATGDEDDDQEEKSRDAQDGMPVAHRGGVAAEAVGTRAESGGDDTVDLDEADEDMLGEDEVMDEEDEQDEDEEGDLALEGDNGQIMSEEDTYTADEDVEMDEEEGAAVGSDDLYFELGGNVL